MKKSIRTSETVNSINEELIEEFRLVFLEVVKDLTEYVSSFCTKDTADWFEKVIVALQNALIKSF